MPTLFSSLIGSLGTYLPKSFVLASFIPTLTFAFLNFATLFAVSPVWRDEVAPRLATLTAGFYYGAALVAVAIIAYFLSVASTYLREILEGRHLWPQFLLEQKRAEQAARAQRLDQARQAALKARSDLNGSKDVWVAELGKGRDSGIAGNPNQASYGKRAKGHRLIDRIRASATNRTELTQQTLSDAVAEFSKTLHDNDINAAGEDGRRLQDDYRALLAAFDAALMFYGKAEVDAFHERQFDFGGDTIAPTRVGNIASSMQDYAETRYGMDLDFFWGRIQSIAAADAKIADTLLNAKTQLDCVVVSVWLAALSTAFWIAMLAMYGYSPLQFVIVTAAGAALTYFSYQLLVVSYYGFADIVRVTIDFYRIELLKRLHIQLPRSTSEERVLWRRLARIAAYGQGELDMAYAP
jgi:hypothetical protein